MARDVGGMLVPETRERSGGEADGVGVRGARAFWPLVLLGLAIGTTEVATMVLLLPHLRGGVTRHTVVDALVLLAVTMPGIYLLSYRPLRARLAELAAARDRALESEERLAEAQRVARLGNWELDVPAGRFAWSPETCRIFGREPAQSAPTYEEWLALVHPEDRERVRASVAEALAAGATFWQCDYRAVLADGTVRHLHAEARAAARPPGAEPRRFGTVQDVTERTVAEEALRREEELLRTLVSLHEGADRLGLRELMEFAVEEMVRTTGSRVGSLCIFDDAAEAFTLCVWSGAARSAWGGAPPPSRIALADAGAWAEAVRSRRAVVANEPGPAGACALLGARVPLERRIGVPILFEGRVVALAVVANRPAPYGPEEEIGLTLLGRGLWEIVQRKRREEEAVGHQRSLRWLVQRLAVAEEEERRRIAVELHDTIVQDLAAARLQLAALRADEPDGARRAALGETVATLDGAIGYTRALTYELSSPLLHQFGIEAALPWLVEQTGRRHELETRCDCGPDPLGLPPEQGALLYRIAQELLRNVVKHARARRVAVRLACEGGGVRLAVEDDGQGFRAAEPRSGSSAGGGFGLFSIRERLREIGGEVAVDTGPGRGTRVTVAIPVRSRAEAVRA